MMTKPRPERFSWRRPDRNRGAGQEQVEELVPPPGSGGPRDPEPWGEQLVGMALVQVGEGEQRLVAGAEGPAACVPGTFAHTLQLSPCRDTSMATAPQTRDRGR